MISWRRPTASKFCLLAVVASFLIHNVRSLKFGQHSPRLSCINLQLSAVPREGQFELSDYVNSNFLPQYEDGVSSKACRPINPTFISRSSALQEYSGIDEKLFSLAANLGDYFISGMVKKSIDNILFAM